MNAVASSSGRLGVRRHKAAVSQHTPDEILCFRFVLKLLNIGAMVLGDSQMLHVSRSRMLRIGLL